MGFVNDIRRRASRVLILLWLAVAVTAIPAAMLAGCGDPESTGSSEGGETAQVQLWTCGMHPNVITEEPGQCPICGMNLTPLKRTAEADELASGDQASGDQDAGEQATGHEGHMHDDTAGEEPSGQPTATSTAAASGAAIVIDPVTIQNIGVQTATVQERPLTRSIRTVGHLDYNEEMFSRINVKYAGWIEKLYVNETGQQIAEGDPMLDIYSPELVAAQEEYLLAFQNVKNLENSTFENITRGASSLLDASKRRLLYWDVTAAQIRELEERGTIARTLTIHAPSKGIVVERMAELGMRVTPGMDLYRMADLSTIWAFAHVYDADTPWLSPGLTAEMELPYNPGKVYRGTIDYIYPYLDRASRDIKIRLVFPNRNLELKPQMYANIRLSARGDRPVLVIPESAVIHSGERNVVFIALEGGRFEPREVTLGMEGEGGYVQATDGVRDGEQVVTSAQFLIDSESRLQEAIQKMLDHRMMH
ncbi:MAG: efflux RND transporter periplasmic adaptor subunit [Gemmatimonadetes bacterium]|nr:efflux RND transporter periplasmic adaptor subunit [Gemmatimonadota bacterium]MYG17613.1 efflux RND transporter periplasmic adaptor subunit [Gemmatimonadota bacterium]MYH18250.1 efflux RND transporter periplasmic adaptor subunit [Gemmatimonadota bacterium]MYK98463.1 efflux RND transporter periplasmic adaptor subunit [Gemmatimonadota bacterium]